MKLRKTPILRKQWIIVIKLRYIEATVEKQNIVNADFTNRDVFSYVVDRGWISIQVFLLRQSTIIKREA